jgi:ABC-2 type transport system permease protein
MSQVIAASARPAEAASRSAQLAESVVFARLRSRLLRNHVGAWLRHSRLRLCLLLVFSVLFWFLLFVLFFEGFFFIGKHLPVGNELVSNLFSLFFISLLVMLVFSTGLILYSSLFKSSEASFLLTTPASPDQVFAYKFQEALGFSSWGFLLLGSPMMIAYGIHRLAPAWFYVVFLAYFLAFIFIPGSIGAVATILIVNYFPRRRRQIAAVVGLAAIVGATWWGVRLIHHAPGEVLSETWLDALLARLRFSRAPLLPSHWMTVGLSAAARNQDNDWRTAIFYFLLLAANAAFLYLIATLVARLLYRQAYSNSQGGQSSRLPRSWYWLDRLFARVFFFTNPSIRLLVLKDIRTFRRDPVQWSQFLIFFGLLALYFLNIRRLSYDLHSAYWRNLVSFLNLAVTALILSTFTTRFVFPMVSLEGRKFWILGLLPLHREHILWGKFAFAAGGALMSSELLVILSDCMLRLDWSMILLHTMTLLILCMGLAGISVGMGARMPSLHEDDPSKIAAGFGGTLNLVISMLYIIVIVVLLAMPCHMFFAGLESQRHGIAIWTEAEFRAWLALSVGISVAIGYAATVVPMKIGARAFRELEV